MKPTSRTSAASLAALAWSAFAVAVAPSVAGCSSGATPIVAESPGGASVDGGASSPGLSGAPVATGTATVLGDVGGAELVARDSTAVEGAFTDDGVAASALYVTISDAPGVCAYMAAKTSKARATSLSVALVVTDPNGAPAAPEPGVYRITDAEGALRADGTTSAVSAWLEGRDEACRATRELVAPDRGIVTLVAVTPTHVVGAFDLAFENGALRGTFDAPLCGVDVTAVDASSACAR